MPKIQMTALLLLIISTVFGQTEWVGSLGFYDEGTDLIRTSQGHTIMMHGQIGITVFDEDGNVLLNQSLDAPGEIEYSRTSKIIEMLDSSIAFMVDYFLCYDNHQKRNFKFDKHWNKVSEPDFFYELNYTHYLEARFSDNSYLFGIRTDSSPTGFGLARMAANGDAIWVINSPVYNGSLVTEGDTIYALTPDAVHKLSSDGNIVAVYPNLMLHRLDILPDGTFLGRVNKTLYRFDSNFNQLAVKEIAVVNLWDIKFDASKIAVLSGENSILFLNYLLETTEIVKPVRDIEYFSALELVEDSMLICGAETFGKYGNKTSHSAFIKKYALDGTSINTGRDAALTNIDINKQPFLVDSDKEIFITDVKLTIKNDGQEPINEITINTDLSEISYIRCLSPPYQYTKSFSNLNLLPGDAVIITLDTLKTWIPSYNFNDSTNICFWVSEPDQLLDGSNDNDISCTSIFAPSNPTAPIEFHHYFNVKTNELHLELPEDVKNHKTEAFVFDAAGHLMLNFLSPSNDRHKPSTSAMAFISYRWFQKSGRK
ncbi:MAG: hypothetical protein IPN76_04635 [Saprospiraceae bacterium]|nr:hypothetical protein [Saprospiraceae bacterium]